MKHTHIHFRKYCMRHKWWLFLWVLILVMFFLPILFPYQLHTGGEVRLDSQWVPIVGQKYAPYASIDEVPQALQEMVVGIEDKRFYWHLGIDPIAVARALWVWLRRWEIQWASTIDQQVIKLDRQQFARSPTAKLIERRWALSLQTQLSKHEILLQYINTIPFANGVVWRRSACEQYRWVSCHQVAPEKRYLLLALAQAWGNPLQESQQSLLLARAKMLCEAYEKDDCGQIESSLRLQIQAPQNSLDPRVSDLLLQLPPAQVFDSQLHLRVDRILEITQSQRAQYHIGDCCVLVLDGSWNLVTANHCRWRQDPLAGKIDMCRVPRQTWSAIKPFLYMYAMQKLNYDKDTTIVDEPVQFDLWGGSLYDPKNFDLTYHGTVSLAYALGNSLNVPAIKLLHEVGVQPFLSFLQQQLQATSTEELNPKTADEVWLSLALWTYETSPLAFTQLWRTFLPGHITWPYQRTQQEIVAILENPINKLVSFGQDSFLVHPGRAVKTGTSRKFIDARICGVAVRQDRVACLRMGNYDNSPMLWPSGTVASYVWSLIVEAIDPSFWA